MNESLKRIFQFISEGLSKYVWKCEVANGNASTRAAGSVGPHQMFCKNHVYSTLSPIWNFLIETLDCL